MSHEAESDYSWGLTCIAGLFDGIVPPKVIVTDRELALMNAIKTILPTTSSILCVWHINKNVLANYKNSLTMATRGAVPKSVEPASGSTDRRGLQLVLG
jgi:MULE transposase domain